MLCIPEFFVLVSVLNVDQILYHRGYGGLLKYMQIYLTETRFEKREFALSDNVYKWHVY